MVGPLVVTYKSLWGKKVVHFRKVYYSVHNTIQRTNIKKMFLIGFWSPFVKVLMLRHWQALLGRKITQIRRLEELIRMKKYEKILTIPCTVYSWKKYGTSLKDYK